MFYLVTFTIYAVIFMFFVVKYMFTVRRECLLNAEVLLHISATVAIVDHMTF